MCLLFCCFSKKKRLVYWESFSFFQACKWPQNSFSYIPSLCEARSLASPSKECRCSSCSLRHVNLSHCPLKSCSVFSWVLWTLYFTAPAFSKLKSVMCLNDLCFNGHFLPLSVPDPDLSGAFTAYLRYQIGSWVTFWSDCWGDVFLRYVDAGTHKVWSSLTGL